MRKIFKTFVLGALVAVLAGCINNDVPYPIIKLDILSLEADGLKTAITKNPRYKIGDAHPIELTIEFFGVTFGSLEEPTNEAGNWGGKNN